MRCQTESISVGAGVRCSALAARPPSLMPTLPVLPLLLLRPRAAFMANMAAAAASAAPEASFDTEPASEAVRSRCPEDEDSSELAEPLDHSRSRAPRLDRVPSAAAADDAATDDADAADAAGAAAASRCAASF